MATNAARKKSKSTESRSTDDSPINVVKEATCLSNTGKSTLGYSIGANGKGDVHFKLTSNSGAGHFSSSWISFTDVQTAFKAWPQDLPVTSMALRPLSRGKSANDAGFACAVLVALGFLEKVPGKSRVHTAIDPKLFQAKVEALKAGGGIPAKKSAKKPKAQAKASAKPKPTPKAKAKSPRESPAIKRKAK
jgi:hypothetical protein